MLAAFMLPSASPAPTMLWTSSMTRITFLAQRIVAGDVPFKLRDKEVYLLDLTALVRCV